MDITDFYVKYKKAIILVGVNLLGLLLLLGVVKFLTRFAAGPMPNPQVATEKEVVAYLASPAVQMLSKSTQVDLYKRTWQNLTPERLERYNQAIAELPESGATQLKENTVEVAKEVVLEYSQEYATLKTPRDKRAYIDQKIKEMGNIRSMLTGRSDGLGGGGYGSGPGGQGNTGTGVGRQGGRPNLAANKNLNKDLPATPAGAYRSFLDRTNPSERAKMETYINDVQNRIGELKSIAKGQSGK
jgi:hypothetical protein